MSVFPAGLCTGMVHGRFIVAVIDGPDDDRDPDVVPARGRIVFRASVEYVTIRTDDGPVTVTLAPISGVLDDEGYLCTPHPETGDPMYRGVTLTSSDGPGMSVTGWTWSADYRLDPVGTAVVKVPAHSFVLPCGGSVDLGDLVKVPSSPGIGIPQMEAVVLRAEAAALESGESAAQAALIAQSVRDDADAGLFDGPQGLPGNATLRVDNTVGKRVFISDGTTEHMISADTGWRKLADLTTGITSAGSVRVRRVNDVVEVLVEGLMWNNAAPGQNVIPSGTTVGSGFSARSAAARPLLSVSDTDITFFDNLIPYIAGGKLYLRWVSRMSKSSFLVDAVTSTKPLAGSLTWTTSDPWPTTLPGIPA